MASYFVASSGTAGAAAAVHDRGRCPPGCFPAGATEYLGEFLEPGQAVAVARLRFPQACPCSCCAPVPAATLKQRTALSSVRP